MLFLYLLFSLGFIIGSIIGGVSVYVGIRLYRKSLGYKPDPFEPENIYLM